MPFLIEGATQGIIGGIVATFLLWATYSTISNYVQSNLSSMHKMQTFALVPIGFSLIVLGVAYGLICSILAIRNPAKLRGGAN
jgi:cell division protein FtsX